MITWQRRLNRNHFGTGHLRHNYWIAPSAGGWILSQSKNGSWHKRPGIYSSVGKAKAAALQLETGRVMVHSGTNSANG